MKTLKALLGDGGDKIVSEMRPGEAFDVANAIIEREERALWVLERVMAVIANQRQYRNWYSGVPGVDAPADSSQWLSHLLSPGADRCQGMAHRLKALARAMHNGYSYDTPCFSRFAVGMTMMTESLFEQFRMPELVELGRQFESFLDYLERALRNGYDQERFSADVDGIVDKLIECCDKVASRLTSEEIALMGGPYRDAGERSADEKLTGVAVAMSAVVRKAKVPPASAAAQRWVREKWMYYKQHPELCHNDVRGRRVRLVDVYDVVKEEARAKYNIASFEQFRRIKRTGDRYRQRQASME